MVSRKFMQQTNRVAIAWSTASSACRVGSLFLLLISSLTLAAQKPSPKLSANLQQAEELRRQGLFDQATGKVQEELEHNPASVEAYNMLGFIYIDEKDYGKAAEALQHALKIAPGSAKTRNNLGNVYLSEQKPDLAENEFRTVLRSDPGNRDANYNLGLLLMGKGSPSEAIPHFERVRPATIATQFNLIHAYLASNRTAEGLRLATELSAQNKDNIQVHFSLGIMLASEKQYKPAELELERADALQPGTFEILYNLGQTFLLNDDYPDAELILTRALKLKPESPETLYLLARVYTNQSRSLDALDLLVRANKITPKNPDILFLMAQIGISQKYFEDAIPLLEKALAIVPQRSDIRSALGESYFMSGKIDKAIEE